MSERRSLLSIAVASALGSALRGAADPQPETPAAVSGASGSGSLASEIQARAGRTLSSLHVEPVPPGHRHEPPARQFNVIGDIVYVREADAPALRAALMKRRATSMGKSEPRAFVLERREQGGDWHQVVDVETTEQIRRDLASGVGSPLEDEYVQALLENSEAVSRLEAGLIVKMYGPAGDIDFRYRKLAWDVS